MTDNHGALKIESAERPDAPAAKSAACAAYLKTEEVRLMWIFTKHGFYSAVCARQGDGRFDRPVDPDRIMVRARLRDHLEALMARFPDLLGPCEILASPNTDYAFRIFASKSAWTQVVAALAAEIDYDNFKGEVARSQGAAGAHYEHALHDVWSAMLKLQRQS